MKGNFGYSVLTTHKPVSFVIFDMQPRGIKKFIIKPGLDDHGVYFFREGVDANNRIIDTDFSGISNLALTPNVACHFGVSDSTISSLKDALSTSQEKKVKIDIESAQVSVENGAMSAFAKTIRGTIGDYLELSKQGGWMKQPVAVHDGEKYGLLTPHPVPKISIYIKGLGTLVFLRCSYKNLEI